MKRLLAVLAIVILLSLILAFSFKVSKRKESTEEIPHILVIPENWNGKCIIFVHGLGSSKESWERDFPFFTSRGFCCLAFDLPYHGERKGKFSFEKFPEVIIEGSNEVVYFSHYLREEVGASEIYAIGRSMGAQVLSVALGKNATIDKAVLLLASANLTYTFEHSVIAAQPGIRNDVKKWLYSDVIYQIDPIYFLPKYRGKVQVHCGKYDEILPPQSCIYAYESLKTEKQLFWHETGHTMPLDEYGNYVLSFFEQNT